MVKVVVCRSAAELEYKLSRLEKAANMKIENVSISTVNDVVWGVVVGQEKNDSAV